MRQCESDLSRKELGLVLREHTHFDQVAEELTALDELHQEVDTVLILEDVLHVDQEWVIDLAQDVFLQLDVLHLLILENDILANDFHGEQLLGSNLLDKEHLTEGTLADQFANLEVLQRDLSVLRASENSSSTTNH